MDEYCRHIKTFEELMAKKRFSKSLSHIVIKGCTKSSFFRKSVDFEVDVYFTPMKKIIFELNSSPLSIDNKLLNIDFKIGDNIQKVIDWCQRNGHEIIFELYR